MTSYLFAYGTLQPGRAPVEIAPAIGKLRPVGKGFVHGVLYDLGDYPGAVLDPSSKQRIDGTVYKLANDASVLRQLDEYEGFDPKSPGKSLFVRTLHPVALNSGGALQCWVYVYNGKRAAARAVNGGSRW